MREDVTELEVCRLSAKALGHEFYADMDRAEPRVYLKRAGPADELWNPLLNAEQRWECVEWLLTRGTMIIREDGEHAYHNNKSGQFYATQTFRCPASEFPARAVAELQKRKA